MLGGILNSAFNDEGAAYRGLVNDLKQQRKENQDYTNAEQKGLQRATYQQGLTKLFDSLKENRQQSAASGIVSGSTIDRGEADRIKALGGAMSDLAVAAESQDARIRAAGQAQDQALAGQIANAKFGQQKAKSDALKGVFNSIDAAENKVADALIGKYI